MKPRCGYGWLIEMENHLTARAKLTEDQFLEFEWTQCRFKDNRYTASVVKRDTTGRTLGSTVVALDDNHPIYVGGYAETSWDERLSVDEVANKAAGELNAGKS